MNRSLLAISFLCLLVSPSIAGPLMKPIKKGDIAKPVAPRLDYCSTCVSFMGQVIDQLINIILNAGVLGTCGSICSQLPNQLEQVVCDLLCDYIGITEFIELIEYEDPDPIWICQVWHFCNHTAGGQAKITKMYVHPTSGPVGTEFQLGFDYTVTKQTSVGLLTSLVIPAGFGFPFGGDQFTEGKAPGEYSIAWHFTAQPSENEPFQPGLYQVDFAICYGDCTGAHEWSGVYDQGKTHFNITSH